MHLPLLLLLLVVVGVGNTPSLAHPFVKRQARTYPTPGVHGPEPLPDWIATYDAAVAAGKIPTFAPSTQAAGANPVYEEGADLSEDGVCSWTVSQCYASGAYVDITDAPTAMFGVNFDDGPTVSSPVLYDFLEAHNQRSTHFMIGGAIAQLPEIFMQAVQAGGHIAIHTWSHPYMTTMTDHQVLGELGWTAQIIYDLSGFVPAFWRPPYGDVDNRVRSIAKEVFGLEQTILWNHDFFDWCLLDDGTTTCTTQGPADDAALDAEINAVLSGPKSPGVLPLQHERTNRSISGFTRSYSNLLASGWDARAIPDLWGVDWYQNAALASSHPNPSISIGWGLLSDTANADANANRIPAPTSRALEATTSIAPTPTEVLLLATVVTSAADEAKESA